MTTESPADCHPTSCASVRRRRLCTNRIDHRGPCTDHEDRYRSRSAWCRRTTLLVCRPTHHRRYRSASKSRAARPRKVSLRATCSLQETSSYRQIVHWCRTGHRRWYLPAVESNEAFPPAAFQPVLTCHPNPSHTSVPFRPERQRSDAPPVTDPPPVQPHNLRQPAVSECQ